MRTQGERGTTPPVRQASARRVISVIGVLMLGAGALIGATAAGAGTAVGTSVPFAVVEDNPCTGEPVSLAGNVHFLIGANSSGGGTEQSHSEANLQGVQGVGLVTGAKYAAVDTSSQTLVFDDDLAPFHSKFEQTAQLIRQGETGVLLPDDFYLHMLAHATINANGTVTVDDFTLDPHCR
jgi:hypothetical protein